MKYIQIDNTFYPLNEPFSFKIDFNLNDKGHFTEDSHTVLTYYKIKKIEDSLTIFPCKEIVKEILSLSGIEKEKHISYYAKGADIPYGTDFFDYLYAINQSYLSDGSFLEKDKHLYEAFQDVLNKKVSEVLKGEDWLNLNLFIIETKLKEALKQILNKKVRGVKL